MKKFWITLLSVIMLVSCVAFVAACNPSGNVLTSYVLTENGNLVDEDFVLPLTISEKEVSWTSSNTSAIEVEKRENDWLAKVNLGDTAESVDLTVKCGKEEKTFSVTVVALDVSYIASKYSFTQNLATVFEDFELDTTCTVKDKTAQISWSVDREEDKSYIAISEDGKTCLVTPSTLNPTVRIYATFKYNGEETTVPYRMTVSFERGHLEEVDYWYNNTGVSITISGYVVQIATAYDSGYKNVSLYVVDDDFCAGYYLYRVVTDDENGALLKEGVHVTATNTTNTNYNGLIETNAGGKLVVDKDADGKVITLSDSDKAKAVYALDNDLLSNAPTTIYNESRLVSLDKWTVKSVEKAPDEGVTATLFTLEKGSATIAVVVSKYLEGAYKTSKDDTVYAGIVAKQGNVQVGSVVSVTGILGKYNTYQLMPTKADDITIESGEATVAPDWTANISKAVTAINKTFTDNAGYVIVGDKTFSVPSSSNDVEISYELLRESSTVALTEGNIVVTAGVEDIAGIKATFSVKEADTVVYETCVFYFIHSQLMDDQDVVEKIEFNFDLGVKEIFGNVDLPTTVSEYPGAAISWALESPVDGVSISADGKTLLVKPSTETDNTVVIIGTITYGTEGKIDKTISLHILKVDPVETGTFKLAVDASSAFKTTLYFAGTISSTNFGETTTNIDEAADILVEEVEDGFTFKVGEQYLELNASNKMTLVAEPTGAWGYDYVLKVFTWTIGNNIYYLGTYTYTDKTTNEVKIYTTLSASKTSYISGSNAANVGVTQFPATFVSANPEAGTYKFILDVTGSELETKLYFTGEIDGRYGVTSEDINEAADIEVAIVEDGYTLKVGEKYLEIGLNDESKVSLMLVDKATGGWVYNSSLKVFTWTLSEKIYYLGTYTSSGKTFTTISASETKYITGSGAANVGVTQFPGSYVRVAPIGTYKYVLDASSSELKTKLYFKGEIDGRYGLTTEDADEAADIVIAWTEEGGYTLKVGEKYLELCLNSENKVSLALVDEATGTWVYDFSLNVFTWTIDEKVYYIGTYTYTDKTTNELSIYTTISASETKYISGANAEKVGVSQFPAFVEEIED